MAEPTCSLPDCGKPTKRAGLCYGHYMKKWRYGDPLWRAEPKWRDVTGKRFGSLTIISRSVDSNAWLCDCDCGARVEATAGDLNRGSKLSCGNPARHHRSDYAGYSAAHQRVRRDRGDASSMDCVDCGRQAHHWSYNHDDPDERLGTSGRSQRPVAFSLNGSHYSPRCVPCHKRFDLDRIDAANPGG